MMDGGKSAGSVLLHRSPVAQRDADVGGLLADEFVQQFGVTHPATACRAGWCRRLPRAVPWARARASVGAASARKGEHGQGDTDGDVATGGFHPVATRVSFWICAHLGRDGRHLEGHFLQLNNVSSDWPAAAWTPSALMTSGGAASLGGALDGLAFGGRRPLGDEDRSREVFRAPGCAPCWWWCG